MKDQKNGGENQPNTNTTQAKSNAPKAKTVAMAKPTEKTEVEKLREELKTLKSQLAEKPMSLEDKIKFFQAKQENISKLSRLDGFAELLIKIGEEVQDSMGENDFSSEKYMVSVTKKDYSHSNPMKVLEINNPVLVVEVLDYALERINTKRESLKTLIEA